MTPTDTITVIDEDCRWTKLLHSGATVPDEEFEDRIRFCQRRMREAEGHYTLALTDNDGELECAKDSAAQALFVLQRMVQFPPRKPFIQ